MHWYLVVIHARNMEIQVLDSIGTSQDRKDLTDFVSMHKLNNYEFNINLSQSLILFYNI
jgi:Ulp1 family protease